MNDFGDRLRQARERRGVSLRQIATSTKISVSALEALERNDVSKLPGGIFSRAFVRSYAAEVGLDPEETVRQFLERFQEEPAAASALPSKVTDNGFESRQRMARVLLRLVLISVPLIGVILYFTLRLRPAPSPGMEPRTPQAAVPASQGPAPPAVSAASETSRPAQAGPMRLELHPTAPCWISLTVDGRRVLSRLMQAGERETYDVADLAVIDVGDAGAFAFSVNGRAGRPIGESGQVRTVRITRETLAETVR